MDIDEYLAKAKNGNKTAMLRLGMMYQKGNGVNKDYKNAAKWFKAAAEKGDLRGMEALIVCYKKGLGVPIDLVKADYWREKVEEIKGQRHIYHINID